MPEKPDAPLDSFDEDGDYRPDACSLRISAAVLHRRAELAGLDAEAATDLIGYASDFWELAARIDGRRPDLALPDLALEAMSDEMGAEIFIAAEGLTCAVASGRLPSIGVETRTFRLVASELVASEVAAIEEPAAIERPGASVASASLIRHASGAWEVLHAEVASGHRRKGLASLLYDRMDERLGVKIRPSGWLSEDAYAFWRRRDAFAVAAYRRIEPFLDLWISPKQLLNLMTIDLAKIEALVESAASDTPQRLH